MKVPGGKRKPWQIVGVDSHRDAVDSDDFWALPDALEYAERMACGESPYSRGRGRFAPGRRSIVEVQVRDVDRDVVVKTVQGLPLQALDGGRAR